MKLLLLRVNQFWYKPGAKSLADVPDQDKEESLGDAVLALIHVEQEDEARANKLTKKVVENIRWLCKKTAAPTVILQSFAHLSDSKSSPHFAQNLIADINQRLINQNIPTHLTPFGYFLEFKVHVQGGSLAKVFKSL